MRKQLIVVATLCGCSHPAPKPVGAQPPAASVPLAAPSPEPAEEQEGPSASAPTPCPMGDARPQLEACLAAISPGDSFTAVEQPEPPFGYVCVFFGTQGHPRCREGDIDVIRQWRDESDPECPKTLTVYWAPHEGRIPVEAVERPNSHLRMRSFPSDGTQFSFIRLDDHMAEATSCLDAADPMQNALTDWATRLLSERPPPQDHP